MSVHTTEGGSSIFFAKTPDIGQLCSVVCQIKNEVVPTHPSCVYNGCQQQKKPGQSNVLKCRELIFKEASVLASPSLQEEGYIYVIVTREFWLAGKLVERCRDMGLQCGKAINVIPAVFQACFTYTLKAKLAPLWNKVGEYYIQGRDFITSAGLLGAISLETNITDGEICFAIKPLTIKLPHCTLQEFGLCPPVITCFLCDPNYEIPEHSMDDKWCYVLPSMKKGRVKSLMHRIPSSSPFNSYNDLRRYWKNTYGYRLPENGDGIVYINIVFPALGTTVFTYPEFCVRKQEARVVRRVDSTPVLQAFLADIKRKMAHVCGTPLEVGRRVQYTTVTMHAASARIGSGGLSSLTLVSRPSSLPQRIPARSLVSLTVSRTLQTSSQPSPQPQAPLYRSLSGQYTSFLPPTGYAIKPTPQPLTLSPSHSLPPSHYGYPHDGPLTREGKQYPMGHTSQRGSTQDGVHSSGYSSCSVAVTPPQHQYRIHQSPCQYPQYSSTRGVGAGMISPILSSPVHQDIRHTPSRSSYISPAASPSAPGFPAMPSPSAPGFPQMPSPVHSPDGRAWRSQQAASINQYPTIKQAPTMENHTMFSLAAQLKVQSHHGMGDTTPQSGGSLSYQSQSQTSGPPNQMQTVQSTPYQPLPAAQPCGALQGDRRPWKQGGDSGYSAQPSWNRAESTGNEMAKLFVPIFNPKRARTGSIPGTSVSKVPSGPKIKPTFLPRKGKSMIPGSLAASKVEERHVPVVDLTSCDDVIPPTQQQNTHYQPSVPGLQQPSYSASHPAHQANPSHLPANPSHLPANPLHLLANPSHHHQPDAARSVPSFLPGKSSSFRPVAPSFSTQQPLATATGASKKRKAKDPGDSDGAKKSRPRSKPKVQENIDVQGMAQSDQLSKVNTVTLVTWLKDKGVAANSRDKKSDLVAKVMTFINCSAKES